MRPLPWPAGSVARERSYICALWLLLAEPLPREQLLDGLQMAQDGIRLRRVISYGEPLDTKIRSEWITLVVSFAERLREHR